MTAIGEIVWASKVEVPVVIVDRLGHFDTIEEVEAKADELWGPIERCEIEGSVPWFKVFFCGKGFDLCTVMSMRTCEGIKND